MNDIEPTKPQLNLIKRLILLHFQFKLYITHEAKKKSFYNELLNKIIKLLVNPVDIDPLRTLLKLGREYHCTNNVYKGNTCYGLYIYGEPGLGKTMLMDLFYETIDTTRKKRIHFHEFIKDINDQIYHARQRMCTDSITFVANEIKKTTDIICIDEFQIIHITDAMIIKRLFNILFDLGIVVIMTSNRPPNDLYSGGLNRSNFISFIDTLMKFCKVYNLKGETDFRLSRISKTHNKLDKQNIKCLVVDQIHLKHKLRSSCYYFSPKRSIDTILMDIYNNNDSRNIKDKYQSYTLKIGSRKLIVPFVNSESALVYFADLCGGLTGTDDYVMLANTFEKIYLYDVPQMSNIDTFSAILRRFISLIDILYDKSVVVTLDAEKDLWELIDCIPTELSLIVKLRHHLMNNWRSLEQIMQYLRIEVIPQLVANSPNMPPRVILYNCILTIADQFEHEEINCITQVITDGIPDRSPLEALR
ncbi:ATPase, AFG1 family protein [Cryptosporidium muris RN66]|uniref:ATPase, AFG1 family protein n=1 Tax=Cryptosporidium muris (strain RN66) TaxID=441375 RepID=B6A9Z5_CRYMR|nr:ATPase, AFG1 family protein [Cryptosporidium muris RN66]EEA05036.1 ATPase, AFG1 family protein [Cryptosporidium muris RN66]|eukprot:XP_002139385.1 ATPase, AFG1 family protein [Cryptosporidium muris RN66]